MAAYGITAHRLSTQFNLPFEEAEKVLKDWYAKLSCGQWINKMRNMPHQPDFEYMLTPMGRKRRFGLITDSNKRGVENESVNFLIQATASDMCLLSLIEMQPILNNLDHKVKIINTVHDSIEFEVDDDPKKIREVCEIAVKIMEDVPTRHLPQTIPFKADVEIGRKSWADKKNVIMDLDSHTGEWYYPEYYNSVKDTLEGKWKEVYGFKNIEGKWELKDIIIPD